MAASRSFLSRILGTAEGKKEYPLAENYVLLRDMVFASKPDSIGWQGPGPANGVWGVVMETAYEPAVATLVAVADGSVSLYFSNGGGIIGLGTQDGPRGVARELIELAAGLVKNFQPTARYPLPRKEHVALYLLTHDGALTAEASEASLAVPGHPLHQVFRKAHDLITEIRLVDEKRQAEEAACFESLPAPGE